MLHFEITLILLFVVLFRYFNFGSLVVPFKLLVKGHRLLSQVLILREMDQIIVATISVLVVVGSGVVVVLPAMMIRTHS
jgi:hypothetical protein